MEYQWYWSDNREVMANARKIITFYATEKVCYAEIIQALRSNSFFC